MIDIFLTFYAVKFMLMYGLLKHIMFITRSFVFIMTFGNSVTIYYIV